MARLVWLPWSLALAIPTLIRLLYGRKWNDGEASTALYYFLYVILLAMNGTSEAFSYTVANEIQLKRSNNSLLVSSLIYLVLNVSLIHSAGAIGLILVNSSSNGNFTQEFKSSCRKSS
uniref:Protein RFT1 homolog n=1 Tax=Nicotiana sylvestris TaxID=4096 RepID=A0A1U7XA70_NICSY|nr:PREDICTED: uncharacterized protein LOC104235646 [Nicotiana sylvestris]